jgi:hypothetical protein
MIQQEYKPDTEFVPFPKIKRLFRDVIVTEKLDGTNGQIYIHDDFKTMQVASRGRYIEIGKIIMDSPLGLNKTRKSY